MTLRARTWKNSVTRTEARTRKIVAYGRRSARTPGISPGRSRLSFGRSRRREPFGTPPFSSFGARLRRRVPQYGHSVMYGDTSELHFLQTTKSSGPLDTPPSLRRQLLRYGRFCDLVHDLVEIVVRLVDDRLPVSAVALLQDVVDPGKLRLGSELLRVRAQTVEGAAGEVARRHAVVAREIDHLAVEPVARRHPAVLVEHLERVVAELLAGLEVLGQLLGHRLDQRREPERVLDPRLPVHRAHLHRAEVRVRADVVPEVRVVLDGLRLDHGADALVEVLPVAVGRWHPDTRELTEDRHPRRGQPGRLAAPERRVGRQREQQRHVDAHPVGDVDGLVGVVHPDVHVQPEDDLLAGHEAQRVDEVAVARAAGDPLVLPERERVRAGRADREVAAAGDLRDPAAQPAQLGARLAGVLARLRRDLEHRFVELGLDFLLRALGLFEQVLDRVHEIPRLALDDHQLLLDAERVAGAAEVRLHGAGG